MRHKQGFDWCRPTFPTLEQGRQEHSPHSQEVGRGLREPIGWHSWRRGWHANRGQHGIHPLRIGERGQSKHVSETVKGGVTARPPGEVIEVITRMQVDDVRVVLHTLAMSVAEQMRVSNLLACCCLTFEVTQLVGRVGRNSKVAELIISGRRGYTNK